MACSRLLRISFFFFFSSRRRHTRFDCDWSSDVCSSDLAAIGEVTENPEIRAVLVTGAGRAFSSGADLKEAAEQAGDGTVDVYKILTERYHPLITGIRQMPKPVIAGVNGPAAG